MTGVSGVRERKAAAKPPLSSPYILANCAVIPTEGRNLLQIKPSLVGNEEEEGGSILKINRIKKFLSRTQVIIWRYTIWTINYSIAVGIVFSFIVAAITNFLVNRD